MSNTKEMINIAVRDDNDDYHLLSWNIIKNEKDIYFDFENGLTNDEVNRSIEKFGYNQLSEKKRKPAWLRFLSEFTNLFSILLQIGSVLCFIGYGMDTDGKDNLYLGVVLYVVVVLTSIFSFYQESKSNSIMESFKNMIPTMARVMRNGIYQEIDSRDVVVGDTIILKQGDKINADIRLFSVTGCKVDNSILTGESEPLSRSVDSNQHNILEANNFVFYGTSVVEGEANGIVIHIGDKTQMGKIADLAVNTSQMETPIHKEIKYFVKIISVIAILIGITFFVMGLIRKYSIIFNIINCISIIVANVPEGLLATVTIILALAAKQMASKNVLVKNLEAVESLGSTSVICTDKTGTLTYNKLHISHISFGDLREQMTGNTDIVDRNRMPIMKDSWKMFMQIGLVCNQAEIHNEDINKPINERRYLGNASDVALATFMNLQCKKIDFDETLCEIPFDSSRKWHYVAKKKDNLVYHFIKGAAERVLQLCNNYIGDTEFTICPIDRNFNNIFDNNYHYFASKGERVLGFALSIQDYNPSHDYSREAVLSNGLSDFIFYGMISFQDPPRENVSWAVKECQTAGVKVVMVTGDHPLTARSIAEQVGIIQKGYLDYDKKENWNDTMTGLVYIISSETIVLPELESSLQDERINAVIVVGETIPKLSENVWNKITSCENVVFARTSPEQKLQIVEHFQGKGEVVAVTGDGVNDSPALKKGDIGIAMGINGSDVSKETADMILLDDNFASIVNGIKEGRRVFENLKKSIAYTLSSNIPEIFPFLLFVAANIPLPLSTVLILFIDLGTDMIPAISFAWDKPEADLMKRPPRKMGVDRLVDWRLINFSYLQIGVIQALAGFATYFYVMEDNGIPVSKLSGLGRDFGRDDLYCSFSGEISKNNIIDCGFNSGSEYHLYKTADESLDIMFKAHTAYFCSIVMVQLADKIICITRRLSFFSNIYFNRITAFGIFVEFSLAALVAYVPFLNTGINTRPIPFIYWLIPLPFTVFIFCYDEMRKLLMRKLGDNHWFSKAFNW